LLVATTIEEEGQEPGSWVVETFKLPKAKPPPY